MNCNKKKIPIGFDRFKIIQDENYYYIDKTELIRELAHSWGAVNLFTRPRRFGKSLNLDMLKTFFEIGSNASYTGCSIELKYAENGAFDAACAEALEQISENKYIDYLKQRSEEHTSELQSQR